MDDKAEKILERLAKELPALIKTLGWVGYEAENGSELQEHSAFIRLQELAKLAGTQEVKKSDDLADGIDNWCEVKQMRQKLVKLEFAGWDNAEFGRIPTFEKDERLKWVRERWSDKFKRGNIFNAVLFLSSYEIEQIRECNVIGFYPVFRLKFF